MAARYQPTRSQAVQLYVKRTPTEHRIPIHAINQKSGIPWLLREQPPQTLRPTTLSSSVPSPSMLALSVNNPTLNTALTGNARTITITNTGTYAAAGLNVAYPTWPGGVPQTTATSTCSSALAEGASCTITITPGSDATSSCNTGIAPTPDTITVSATNVGTPLTSNVVVLSYGCQYQGGFLYSVDDTTNNGVTGSCSSPPCTGSIGGKVASLVDQAAPFINSGSQPTSIIWSSNGNGPMSSDVDYRAILGIDDTSTTLNASPTSPPYPPTPPTPTYLPCNGASDGACDSTNIVSYYNANRTSGGSAPTPVTYYATGLCTTTINTYSDWYLPAICELNAISGNVTCPSGAQSMAANIVFLVGDPTASPASTSCMPPSGTSCLAGFYWSSTERSNNGGYDPQNDAWYGDFHINGSTTTAIIKLVRLGVRCSRILTF